MYNIGLIHTSNGDHSRALEYYYQALERNPFLPQALNNIAVIFPDTSPRGTNIPDDDAYDLGQGAGFYLNATQSPWKENYKMWDYLVLELPSLIEKNFSVNTSKQSVMGHSMGGHGALLMALRLNNQFKSVSAFAPICNPMKSDWGRK